MSITLKLTDETIRYITLFETVTRAHVKDCIENDKLVFIVEPGQMGMAIGRGGENIRKLRELLKKRVEVIEFSPEEKQFIINIFHNFNIKDVNIVDRGGNRTAYVSVELKDKGKIIGKNGRNLRLATEIVGRHFEISNVFIQ